MYEREIRTREDLPRPENEGGKLTIEVRLIVNRNVWAVWCAALSAEYGQPVEGFDAKKGCTEGEDPLRVGPEALRHLAPPPILFSIERSFDEEIESSRKRGYSLWAIWPGDTADIEFEIRRRKESDRFLGH